MLLGPVGVIAQPLAEGEHILIVCEADLAIVSSLDEMLGYVWVAESSPPGHVESFPGRLR